MKLIIAVGVPYEVEITASGIPMHEAKVEFTIKKRDISFSFPAKMVDDKKFVFNITNDVNDLVNKTHEYSLHVYYGNARFEADSGKFNLVDKEAFTVKMQQEKGEDSLASKLKSKTQRARKKEAEKPEPTVPKATKKDIPKVTETPKVTATEVDTTKPLTPTFEATKPTPTPTVETTTTLKEAKDAIKNTKEVQEPIEEGREENPNDRIKKILSSINKTATPNVELAVTPDSTVSVTETQEPGQFFKEIEKMRAINEKRRKNKEVKDIIRKTTKK